MSPAIGMSVSADLGTFSIGFDPPRPRAAPRAVGRGPRLRAVVPGRDDQPLRGGVERLERRRGGRHRVAGPAPRSRRSSSPGSAAGRPVPLEHLHGHAAGDPARGRPPGVRRLQPRRPLRVLRGLRGEGAAAPSRARPSWCTSAGTSPSTSSASPRSAAPRASSCSRTAPTPTGPRGTAGEPGTFGDAGAYSLYATKTISTGEGGVLVSAPRRAPRATRAPFATTASPTTRSQGLNFRMSEFTAALGLVQIERLDEIVAWKNARRARRSSTRGIRRASSSRTGWSRASTSTSSSTGSSARPARSTTSRATASWAPATTCPTPTGWPSNHWCVPLYYRPEAGHRGAASSRPRHRRGRLHRLARRRPAARRRPRAARSSTCAPRPTTRPARSTTVDRRPARRSTTLRDGDARLRRGRPPRGRRRRRRGRRGSPGRRELNARGTLNVLEAARAAGVDRVVYASTIWVYSDVGRRRRSTRRRCSARPRTSTRRPSSPARCTAAPTPSSTALESRSCASASPTARARGRPR